MGQDTPTYAGLSVADHLRLGAHLNPAWDAGLAADRVARLGLDPDERVGRLSGGQRAQLALTFGVSKRPELLLLDEPVAMAATLIVVLGVQAALALLVQSILAKPQVELHRSPSRPSTA